MKRYVSIIEKEYLYLSEGKKQASQMLDKYFSRDIIKKIVNNIEEIDPSKNNKYVELLTKIFRNMYLSTADVKDDIKFVMPLLSDFKKALEKNNVESKLRDIENRNLKIDINRINNDKDLYNELEKITSKITKSKAKKGITGLKEGKDYIDFGEINDINNNSYHGYIPLNYEASKIIASSRVGSCEGKWCVAYQKDKGYWKYYVKKNKNIFVYLVKNNAENNEFDKLAAQFDKNGKSMEIWDASDKNHSFYSFFK